MASLWKQMAGDRNPTKVIGHLTLDGAKKALAMFERSWTEGRDKRHRVVRTGTLEATLVRDDEPVGTIFIELLSPPSKAEPGDLKRVGAR